MPNISLCKEYTQNIHTLKKVVIEVLMTEVGRGMLKVKNMIYIP